MEMVTSAHNFFCLHHTVFPNWPKRTLILVCERDEITEKILVDPFNIKFNSRITHLEI